MGGLANRLPWTHATMLAATLAIAGIPPFAGFFSKDEILSGAYANGHFGIWLVGLLAAVLTAFYMFRLYILTFRGESRVDHEVAHHLHESPPTMLVPLVVLAVLATVGGLVGPPMQHGGHAFERWLSPVFESGAAEGVPAAHALSAGTEWLLIVVSVLAAALGIAFAFRAYLPQASLAERLQQRWSTVHRILFHKYWVDEAYDALVVSPVYSLSQRLWRFWDVKVVDGTVNGVGYTFEGLSAVLRLFQTGFVGTYALFFVIGVLAVLYHFLRH
jgi:NADH-quinone oxidoreductase subunit L